jgi:hypothetical protein
MIDFCGILGHILFVQSMMFIPVGLKKSSMASVVIYCSGRSIDGYRSEDYQQAILSLVKKVFFVFTFDPV